MSMPITSRLPTVDATTGRIGVIASAGGFAAPLVAGINHLAGYKLGGLLHHQVWETAVGGTGRFMTYRVPNCDYLVAAATIAAVTGGEEAEADRSIDFTAGTAAGVSVNVIAGQRVVAAFPWAAADTWEEVTYEMKYCTITSISIWCLCRESLTTGDDYLESIDTTNHGAGFNEDEFLIHDGAVLTQNICGATKIIRAVRDNTIRQAVSWSDPTEAGEACTGTSDTNPFTYGLTFKHTARNFSSTKRAFYRVYAYTKVADLTDRTYSVKLAATSDSVESTGLTNTTYAWTYLAGAELEPLGGGSQDTFTLTMKSTDTGPTMTIAALSIVQTPVV